MRGKQARQLILADHLRAITAALHCPSTTPVASAAHPTLVSIREQPAIGRQAERAG
ncbi:hypothetical protein CGRA01v4_02449 [Colletotrichum graminicola]|nr:hypothetical protein CGRA01v4_02449 [Colletotrichum graminicola]